METFCLVLADRLGTDDATTRSRLAAAFDMDEDSFREKIWCRAPLVIRRGLGAETAAAQAARLAALGAVCEIMPDAPPLLWLRREGRTRGPLPDAALERFAHAGDLWCRGDLGTWQPWPASIRAMPPPLPASVPSVPPMPVAEEPRRRSRTWAWIGGIALLVLLLVFWPRHDRPRAGNDTVAYVPRPLHPLAASTVPSCRDEGAAPTGDEDRFLLTGGQRALTGRSQRNGDTYVAEATSHSGPDCADTTVQLYLFRSGGFVGPATPEALSMGTTRFASFELVDPEHLRYVVDDSGGPAAAATSTLLKRADGWVIRTHRPVAAPTTTHERGSPRA